MSAQLLELPFEFRRSLLRKVTAYEGCRFSSKVISKASPLTHVLQIHGRSYQLPHTLHVTRLKPPRTQKFKSFLRV